MDLTTISQKIESSTNYIIDRALSANRQDAEKLGKVAAITLATYFVSSVKSLVLFFSYIYYY